MECIYSNDISTLRKAEGIVSYKIPQQERLKHLASVLENDIPTESKHIPNVLHQIWVTSPHAPQEMTDEALNFTLDSFDKMLFLNSNFKSIFWTNDPLLIPNTIKSLKAAGIEVRIINDFDTSHYKNFRFDLLLEKKEYGKVSDIFRYLVIEKYGGIYRDVDYEILNHEKLTDIINNVDFFAGFLFEISLGTGIFGAIPEHSILQKVTFLVNRNFGIDRPEYQKKACNPYSETIIQTGPAMFDIAVYSRFQDYDIDTKDLVFNQGVLYDACKTPFLNWKNSSCISCIDYSNQDIALIGQVGNDNLSAAWVSDSAFVPFTKYRDLKETYHDQPSAKDLAPNIKVNSTNLSFFLHQISDCDIENIIQILKNNPDLTSINLALQRITPVGAIKLSEFLKTSNITHINLGGNGIGDEGAKYLAASIMANTEISYMKLWGNNITDSSAIVLANAIYEHPSLTYLDLSFNDIGILGASALIFNKNININIEFWGNKITEQELEYLLDLNQCLL